MAIETGQKLPDATLFQMGAEGPETVDLGSLLAGKKVAIFGFVGAYTGTCAEAHVPSFIRTKDDFAAKGVDTIIGIGVNDPFVMGSFAASTGADKAGIILLADVQSEFSKAIGMTITAAQVGLFDRSNRYAMLVEDGTVTTLQLEDNPGICTVSGGEALLAAI